MCKKAILKYCQKLILIYELIKIDWIHQSHIYNKKIFFNFFTIK